jgi:hypothetical protein
MAHGRDKPGREKRKPKKSKAVSAKSGRDAEVLQHVAQQPREADPSGGGIVNKE